MLSQLLVCLLLEQALDTGVRALQRQLAKSGESPAAVSRYHGACVTSCCTDFVCEGVRHGADEGVYALFFSIGRRRLHVSVGEVSISLVVDMRAS